MQQIDGGWAVCPYCGHKKTLIGSIYKRGKTWHMGIGANGAFGYTDLDDLLQPCAGSFDGCSG